MKFLASLLMRWLVSSLGLWIAAGILGENSISYQDDTQVILIAGLLLALINMFIRPIVMFLSLPAILLTLGLFTLIVNGLMVSLVSALYEPLHIANFLSAILAGMVIGLVNYLITTILERK